MNYDIEHEDLRDSEISVDKCLRLRLLVEGKPRQSDIIRTLRKLI